MIQSHLRLARTAVTAISASVIVMSMLVACDSSSGSKNNSSAKSYCAGKTVRFLSPDDPGGAFDIEMRIIGPAISQILGCPVHVQNAPQGNTILGEDLAAEASPDGLTVGIVQPSKDLYNKATGGKAANFDLTTVEFIGSTEGTPNVVISAPNSPYKTFEDVLKSPTPVKILGSGGSAQLTITMLLAAYGRKADLVSGYSSQAELIQGFLRGDGPVTNSALAGFQSIIESGKAHPILLDVEPAEGESATIVNLLKDVPTYQDLVKDYPPPTADGADLLQKLTEYKSVPGDWFFTAKNTPANAVKQLQDAFQKALVDPDVQKKLQAVGVSGYVSAVNAVKDIEAMQELVPYMQKYAAK